jgi:hypothetical protein
MKQVRVDKLTRGNNQTQYNMFFGKLKQLFFDPAWWWWLEATIFFLLTQPNRGENGLLNRKPSRS